MTGAVAVRGWGGGTRSTNPDPTIISSIYSSSEHLACVSCGEGAGPGTGRGNQANRTQSGCWGPISHLVLFDPLTLPYAQKDSGYTVRGEHSVRPLGTNPCSL